MVMVSLLSSKTPTKTPLQHLVWLVSSKIPFITLQMVLQERHWPFPPRLGHRASYSTLGQMGQKQKNPRRLLNSVTHSLYQWTPKSLSCSLNSALCFQPLFTPDETILGTPIAIHLCCLPPLGIPPSPPPLAQMSLFLDFQPCHHMIDE
jgi:hypothetical protein